MTKKIPLIISLLVFGLTGLTGNIVPISAYAEADITKKDYWTFEEALAIDQKYQKIINDLCHGDFECKEQYYIDHIDIDSEYRLSENFHHQQILLTSINPSTSKFAIYQGFRDEMEMMFFEDNSPDHFTAIYLAWLEPGVIEPIQEYSWLNNPGYPYFVRDFKNGLASPGTHFVLNDGEVISGENWFMPGTVKEFTAINHDLSLNTSGRIQFTTYSGQNDIIGVFDYSSCLGSPDYQEGMECKIMLDEFGSYLYVPTTVNSDSNETADGDTTTIRESNPQETVAVTTSESITELLSPETGSVGHEYESSNSKLASKINFPWWLGALLGLNFLVLLWLFLPIGLEKTKKRKKSLDKIKSLR